MGAGGRRLKAAVGGSRLFRSLLRSLLLSEAGQDAVLAVVRGDDRAVRLEPDTSWLRRRPPANERGPRIVSYNDHDPRPIHVGPYSSLNDHSYLMPGSNHRIDRVTTWVFYDAGIDEADQVAAKGPIEIGSDVVVSFEALVLSGVSIGHGAVVAARAVVTKDVPPYAIVAGVPAQIIGWRFDEEVRAGLLRIAWWDWPEELVRRHAHQLADTDARGFVERHDPRADRAPCPDCP